MMVLVTAVMAGAQQVGARQAGAAGIRMRQTPPPPRTVSIDVVVTSKSGKPVTGLKQTDFTLLDDKKPQTITAFHAYDGSQEPVEAILLIDGMNATFQVIASERFQIDKFLHANQGKLPVATALAVLTDEGIQMQGAYTKDGNQLAETLDKHTIGLRSIGRSAGVQGASERMEESLKAVRMLLAYEASRPGRKMVLWISPGWPVFGEANLYLTSSQQQGIFHQITWFSTQLRSSRTTFYSVNPLGVEDPVEHAQLYREFVDGVKKPQDVAYADLSVQVLAIETGGLVENSGDISGPLQKCMEDAGGYYRISFEPAKASGRDVYHSLGVTMGERSLSARTTTGYYAQP